MTATAETTLDRPSPAGIGVHPAGSMPVVTGMPVARGRDTAPLRGAGIREVQDLGFRGSPVSTGRPHATPQPERVERSERVEPAAGGSGAVDEHLRRQFEDLGARLLAAYPPATAAEPATAPPAVLATAPPAVPPAVPATRPPASVVSALLPIHADPHPPTRHRTSPDADGPVTEPAAAPRIGAPADDHGRPPGGHGDRSHPGGPSRSTAPARPPAEPVPTLTIDHLDVRVVVEPAAPALTPAEPRPHPAGTRPAWSDGARRYLRSR
ncbi:MAG: hypothetical protein SYR96_24885 [Actinomycetota bacterium]|nr:hypothetical protein [Actinomycetota bacterium]